MKIDTILVPTDFSDDANKALETATDLAKLAGAKILVVHAYHVEIPLATPLGGDSYRLPEGFYEQLRSEATEQVDAVAADLRSKGIEASGIACQESASSAIVEQAARNSADLIVMGTRGLTGVKHVLLGSVAERVVRLAPCAVLTVKHSS